MDSLLDDYTRSWEGSFAVAFDTFRKNLAEAKRTRDDAPNDYWLIYGVGTRVNSDRREVIQRRHEFFAAKMREGLKLQLKDPQRAFGALERELIYYRDQKRCAVCDVEVVWSEGEIHHLQRHSAGGKTELDNGVLVHQHCHPKSAAAEKALLEKWQKHLAELKKAQVDLLELLGPDALEAAKESDDNGA